MLFLDSIRVSFPWKAIRKKLYRNSYLQSFWLAFVIWLHKKLGTWKMADRYILQTELARSVFESSSAGINKSKFAVKPNFIVDPGFLPEVREECFLYVGRLSGEKGISTLLGAFRDKPFDLFIGGDGPLKSLVLESCETNSRIHYLGLLDKGEVTNRMRKCSALIFPSLWYEGMPLTLIEAFATGTPVIASNLGAMASMILDGYNGMHFTAGDVKDLSSKLDEWSKLNKDEKSRFSLNARVSYESLYSPKRNREQLLTIYQEVLNHLAAG
jgi:glycosyltransferase involved in cell wall biosynthesis